MAALTAHRLLDGQLLSPALGYRLLGAGLRRLGLSEPHLRAAHFGAGPLRIPLGRCHGEPVPDGRGAAEGLRRRHQPKLDPGEPEERNIYEAMEAGKKVKKLPMSLGDALDRLEQDEVDQERAARRHVPGLHALQARRVGEFMATVTRLGLEMYLGLSAVEYADLPAQDPEERTREDAPMCGIAGLIHRGKTGDDRPGNDGDAAEP